jgi:hypothetical protein
MTGRSSYVVRVAGGQAGPRGLMVSGSWTTYLILNGSRSLSNHWIKSATVPISLTR